jgi:hypothetical protein
MSPARSSSKRWLLALVALPLGVLGAWIWQLHHEAADLRERVATLNAEQTRLRGEISALADRRDAVQRDLQQANAARATAEAKAVMAARPKPAASLSVSTLSEESAPPPAALTRGPRQPPPPSGPHGNLYFPELFGDPHYAQLYLTWMKQRQAERYAALFAALPLSAADLARFKELLLQREMATEEVDGILANQAMRDKKAPDLREASQVKTRVTRAFDDEIRQTFGNAVWMQSAQFQGESAARQDFLDALISRLSYSPAPLENAQIKQLLTLYRSTREAAYAKHDYSSGMSDAFVAAAQTVLKPEQIPGLLQIQLELRPNQSGGGWSVGVRPNPTATPSASPPSSP